MTGIELARLFYTEQVQPYLQRAHPNLDYAAALIGNGSEVLGYDTDVSIDHDFGPRLQLFLKEDDFSCVAQTIIHELEDVVPDRFQDFAVDFPNRHKSIGWNPKGFCGSERHAVEAVTIHAWFDRTLGVDVLAPLQPADWLRFPSQSLAAATAGAVFHDGPKQLSTVRNTLSWYPTDIWYHLLACQWMRLSQEQPFIGRCGDVGDELGSAVIAARLVRDLMRLAFLLNRRHAPYPKWFGTAFLNLPETGDLPRLLPEVMRARDWREREGAYCAATLEMGRLQIRLGIPSPPEASVGHFHTRSYRVVNADDFVSSLRNAITDQEILLWPKIGSVDQVSDNTDVLCSPRTCRAIGQSASREPRP